ncbi:MAG: DUF1553 domain-containing protein [Acidobacteria bacterium]|nr:DUF1553 domain-containing protein [Acidobacteriota bacterium]MCI0723713.1 DUF1553 domain-containing protein [Acidobacteriota bacterium]
MALIRDPRPLVRCPAARGALLLVIIFSLVAPSLGLFSSEPQSTSVGALEDAGRNLYSQHIRPLFEEHCQSCHTGESGQGGFDLSTTEGLLHGGKSGRAVVPGNASGSLLYKLVAHKQEPVMPHKAAKLSREVIALLEVWINVGAPTTPDVAAVTKAAPSPAVQDPNSPPLKLFKDHVRPVLQTQCLSCHGGKFRQAGLALTTRDGLLRGSDNGPVVIPGKADASLLIKKIRHEHEPGMPYKGQKLPNEAISHFIEWVNAGVPYDRALDTNAPEVVSKVHRSDHWAFQTVTRPSVPKVKNRLWVRNPIDAFVAAKHEEKGLVPLRAAEKNVLLRRVTLDLVGLPPTPAEIQAFQADSAPDAHEKLVDRLLASPRYGERWGRHWMDIWRYSDWYGFGSQIRNSQPHMWQWRDWIIESLNQDKGYDRMVLEMLAGDELAPTDLSTLRATGYLARTWYRFNRNVWMQETVEHVAAGFMGITLKCARCHDHKYDPIAQEEYYKFRAFFEPYDVRLERISGEPDVNKSGIPRVFDAEPREATTKDPFLPPIYAETYRFIRGDERSPDKEHPLSPAVPEALGNRRVEIQAVQLPREAAFPALRDYVREDLMKQAKDDINKAETNLARTQAAREAERHRLAAHSPATPAAISAAAPGAVAATSEGPSPVGFAKDIKPIFERNCLSCHKAGNAKSGLVLETLESIEEGGRLNGAAVIPRRSSESPVTLYLQGKKKPRMPFGSAPLPAAEIALIQKWIDQLPEEEPAVALRKAEAAAVLSEKQLASARAYLPAVEARIEADKSKLSDPPNPKAESLAKVALQAERQYQLVKAQENLFKAQQKLTEVLSLPKPANEKAEKDRDRRIAAARKEVDSAQAALARPGKDYTPIAEQYPKTSSGRRLALAQWLTAKDNPLTARVAVNHIWLRHFGKPLVPTVVNFGLNGKPPSHPELLDWLASELMEKNWSMKAIHRLMVTSNTYRMQSFTPDPGYASRARDLENIYLWRMNSRRMEAEIVRDSLLSVAGQLDTTMGGPELEETQAEQVYRRSLYFHHTPDSQATFLKLFNAPDPTDCYKREESVVPQQALALANSGLSRTQARLLSRKISEGMKEKMDDAKFIRAAFETTLGRQPVAEELAESQSFLRQQASLFAAKKAEEPAKSAASNSVPPADEPSLRARENLVHVLFNHNDFVTIR